MPDVPHADRQPFEPILTAIDAKAAEVRQQCQALAVPVDVVGIVTKSGITLSHEPYPDDGISGMLYRPFGAQPVIGINAFHKLERRRFSIAHALGHFFLHHDRELFMDGQAVHNYRDVPAASGTWKQEQEANEFALALLIPEPEVIERFMPLIDGKPRLLDEQIVTRLAAEFEVTESAMMARLVNLALVVSL